MSVERMVGVNPEEKKAKEVANDQAEKLDDLDIEVVRQRLIQLGVLAEGTPLSEQRKPYLGQ